MKLTKKLEIEVLKFYKTYWDCYLNGDMKTLASMLDDDITVFGSAVSEVFYNKKEALRFYTTTADQLTGKAQMRNRKINLQLVENNILINEQCDLFFLLDKKWTYYGHVRISAILKHTKRGWKVIQQHASFPDMRADEGEQLASEKIKEENLQLRDAVKRRTIELEEKNHELEIEAALERVRTVAMAMKNPDDLINICQVLFKELKNLGFDQIRNTLIHTFNDHEKNFRDHDYSDLTGAAITTIPYSDQPIVKKFLQEIRKSKKAFSKIIVTGTELKDWKKFRRKGGQKHDVRLDKAKSLYYYIYSVGIASIGISTFSPVDDEKLMILKRFRNVFELAYQRYNDIAIAKAQAREAQIEASLERVRARTMSMHSSSELSVVIKEVTDQIQLLGFDFDTSNMGSQYDEKGFYLWNSVPGEHVLAGVYVPKAKLKLIDWFYGNKSSFNQVRSIVFNKKDTNDFFKYYLALDSTKQIPAGRKKFLISTSCISLLTEYRKDFTLSILNYRGIKYSNEETQILTRFANVFEQAYTRFLDLQKAEAQAREAQIETGLERVRSKTMAMHKSSEVTGIAVSLNEELLKLGFEGGSTIMIMNRETGDTEQWTGFSEDKTLKSCVVPYFKHPYHDALFNNWKSGEKFLVYTVAGKEKRSLDAHYFSTGYKDFPESDKKWMKQMRSVTFSHAFMKYGAIHWGPGHLTENQLKILERFSKVFEQSYTRFLDLQKAEAQAREAKIEAALEKIRSRSLGMHRSDEIKEVVLIVLQKLRELALAFDDGAAIFLFHQSSKDASILVAAPHLELAIQLNIPFDEKAFANNPIISDIWKAKETGEPILNKQYTFEEKNVHFNYLFKHNDFTAMPEVLRKELLSKDSFTGTFIPELHSGLATNSWTRQQLSDKDLDVLKRVAKVFEQAYTRFVDLQKAEAQTREAEIELALERVRAKAMAMQKPAEFAEVINVIGEQFVHLDFDIEWANFGANGLDVAEGIDTWNFAVIPGGDPVSSRLFIPRFDHPVFIDATRQLDNYRKTGDDFFVMSYGKKDKDRWLDHLFTKTIFKDVPDEYRDIQYAKPGYTTSNLALKDTFLSIGKFDTKSFTDEQNAILRRFGNAFGQAYTRFLDLQKAEAQARESQIQLALERVRARTMAMQHSDELKNAATLLFQQVKALGVPAYSCGYNIWEKDEQEFTSWMSTQDGTDINAVYNIPLTEDANFIRFTESKQKGEQFFVLELRDERMQEHYQYLKTIPAFKEYFDYAVSVGFDLPRTQIHHIANFSHGNLLFITLEPCPEFHDVFKRFAAVFEQTYTRFLDLQKAETQAREAQIELGLERVRARAMAMQNSDELKELIGTVFTELTKLDLVLTRCVIMIYDGHENNSRWWMANSEDPNNPAGFFIKQHEYPPMVAYFKAWRERQLKWTYALEGQIKKDWDVFLFNETELKKLPDFVIEGMKAPGLVYLNASFNNFGNLTLASLEPLSDEHFDILLRFAKVFDLTYTRFNDLKQAEAQAREAQIQLALERVRARTMAMQHSDELPQAANLLFQQIQSLGMPAWSAGYCIWDEDQSGNTDKKGLTAWMSSEGVLQPPFKAPTTEDELFIQMRKGAEEGKSLHVVEMGDEKLVAHYKYMRTLPVVGKILDSIIEAGHPLPTFQIMHHAYFSKGFLLFITYEPVPEAHDIFKRFASVFDQTYTRFLDLQKSEAQARESQIQLALERVRARTMAMQRSDELAETASLLFKQISDLGIQTWTSGFNIWEENNTSFIGYNPTPAGEIAAPYHIPSTENSFFKNIYEAKKRGEEFLVFESSGESLAETYNYMKTLPVVKEVLNSIEVSGFKLPDFQINHCVFFSQGFLLFITLESYPDAHDIFKRFGKVFEQTYTRFLDLQKAEAQARESQIQLALERVRARTMAMQKSEELPETSHILFEQMKELGEPVEQLTIGVVQEENKVIEISATLHGDILKKIYQHSLDEPFMMSKIYHAWKTHQKTLIVELKGDELNAYNKYRNELTKTEMFPTNLGDEHRRIVYAAFFSKGMLALGANEPRPPESLQLLERFAGVFDQAYIRFIDLKNAEAQAREAQIEAALERVRSRTMAMHQTSELQEVIHTVHKELLNLDLSIDGGSFVLINDDVDPELRCWGSGGTANTSEEINVPHFNMPFCTDLIKGIKRGPGFFTEEFSQEEKKKYFTKLFEHKPWSDLSSEQKKETLSGVDGYTRSVAVSKHTSIFIINHHGRKFTEAENDILKRFAKVFEQTYTRFLDLQKAEAQAKESKIQLALERVRARTMAMQKSEELSETSYVLFQQFNELGEGGDQTGIGIFEEDERSMKLYSTFQGSQWNRPARIEFNKHRVYQNVYAGWKNKKKSVITELTGKELQDLNKIKLGNPDYQVSENELAKDHWVVCTAFFSNGILSYASHDAPKKESIELLERFASVFDHTYTRFLDLQKAEAQARESQIETALERVRAVAMAMRKPEELMQISKMIYDQLQHLGFEKLRNVQIAIDDDAKQAYSGVEYSEYYQNSFKEVSYNSSPMFREVVNEMKRSSSAFYQKEISGEEFEAWKEWRRNVDDENDRGVHPGVATATSMHFYLHSVGSGMLGISTFNPITNEQLEILKRFKNVFELSYRRYIDIEKAEIQAREAQIELALERVRARTMAMHRSEELAETAQVLFHQLNELNVVPDRIAIGIADEINNVVNFWSTDQAGSHISNSFKGRLDERTVMSKGYMAWKDHQRSLVVDLQGDDLKEWIQFAKEEMKIPVKEENIKGRRVHNFAFFSHGWILVTTHEPQSAESIQTLERFASVFSLTYRRFLDLQKAEAQAREAQIELGLERVRARAMAMQKSDELADAAQLLYHEFGNLGINTFSCGYMFIDEAKHTQTAWVVLPDGSLLPNFIVFPLTGDHVLDSRYKDWKEKRPLHTFEIQGEVNKEHHRFLSNHVPPFVVENIFSKIPDRIIFHCANFSDGYLLILATEFFSPEEQQTIIRFAKVFEMTYTRFNDLKQAEAQIREAQIEAALERVRAKAMAMHKTEDFNPAVAVVFEELEKLNIGVLRCGISVLNKEKRTGDIWVTSTNDKGSVVQVSGDEAFDIHPLLQGAFEAWLRQEDFSYMLEGEDLARYYNAVKQANILLPESQRGSSKTSFNRQYCYTAVYNAGGLFAFRNEEFSDEGKKVMKRFANVFDLTYKRFLDLQKAEAQAREAQIEAALERVRSSSLAMHKSEELKDVVKVVLENFRSLGLQNIDSVNINILHEGRREFDLWLAAPGQDYTTNFHLPYFDHPIANDFFNAINRGETIHKGIYDYDSKNKYFGYMFEYSDNKYLPEERKKLILSGKAYSVATGNAKYSSIFINNYNGEAFSEETNGILVRFSKVFDQAYTRFLDLQKAEAQAREAQIEASLERVRSKTMAMHNSNDVGDTVATMFAEFVNLGIETIRCGIAIIHDLNHMEVWTAKQDENGKVSLTIGTLPMTIHPMLVSVYEHWKNKKSQTSYELIGEDLKNYFREINNSPDYPIRYDIDTLPQRQMNSAFYFPEGCLFTFSENEIVPESAGILKRFAGVFGQTYRRYLDLQKAEAQAREAQIEVSLERIRAKAMAMHSSKDLGETLNVFYRELKSLSVTPIRCGVALMDKEVRKAEVTTMNTTEHGDSIEIIGTIKMSGHPVLDGVYDNWLAQKEYHAVLRGNQIKEYYQVLKPQISYLDYSHDEVQFGYYFMFKEGDVYAWTEKELTEDELNIYRRFTTVISLTYKRYKDLQQAEAQAREAKIEAGLERVRARTMAMHSSDDVGVATATMFTELEKLGIENLRGGITIIKPDQTQEVWSVTNMADGRTVRAIGVFDMNLHPLWRGLLDGKLKNDDYLYYWMAGQDKEDYINILNATPNYLAQPIKEFPDVHVQSYFFGEGAVWTNSLQPHSEDDKQVMKRFASVFSLTFRRYQDLKKAEAQAREAQVEMALEKIRASTMAMQKSEDLSQAAFVLFKQFKELGESPERIFIATFDAADENLVDLWGTSQGGNQLNKLFRVSADEPTVIKKIVNAWKEKKSSVIIDLTGDELKNYLQFLENMGIPVTPGIMTERRVQTVACFSKGVIGVTTPEPRPAASIQLLERFANVFDLTYTRFLDLLQAEAQAREATIEAALEKVRGKAMAMHNSNDLSATASIIFTELRKLGINPIRCGVGLLSKESRKAQLYSAGDNLSLIGWVQLTDHPVLEKIYDAWLNNEEYYPELEGEQMHLYYVQLLKGLSVTPPDTGNSPKQYGHFIPFSIGCLYAWADQHYDDADIRILKRFASIIDLTFRRYIELQKSEANAREAVKQAALDRVRADIASMRTVEDLDRITPLIWNELTILGIPFIRCGVFIMDETQQFIHTFLSTPDGKAIGAFHLPYDTPGNIRLVLNNWRNKNRYVDHWNEEEFHQFAQILVQEGALDSAENYLKTIPHGGFYLHFLPFLQGMLYVGNTTQLNSEMVDLVQSVADAFSTAYARYEDFNRLEAAKKQVENTLSDLKQAQQQLVQSEKMASLGELTAGIAHEIQNPLNFVNNFSDVSNELLEEMKHELEKGNKEDAIAIVEDVKQNLEKILHHGKRADAIVKGMLQHSRINSGQKEMTDINSLTDEYLRLAFHGLRAKDKTFNAKFETHFDANIEKINIIPQDIGRVILNLINNAFYTVTEKKKVAQNGYEPTVTVTTLKDNGRIEIKVKDNGNGIPQKNIDKIFQPFFTTKPTGQGTGLGLSLAYDIVTKGHGGELKVETKEGEGSEFIIQLPAN